MDNIDYKKILKRSWELTWHNKWLWVMGLTLAVFGGSGYHGGSGGSSSSKVPSASPSPGSPNLQNIKDQTSTVLGDATNAVLSWVKSIPTSYWLFIGLGIFIFTVFSVVVVWVVTAWAKGALIYGLTEADNGKSVNLKTVSPKGIAKIRDLIVFSLISASVMFLLVLGVICLVLIGFVIKLAVPTLGTIWLVLFGILATLAFVVAVALFSLLVNYSERLIVLHDYSPWNAWKKGLSLAKGNFIHTFVMTLIDGLLGCTFGCLGLFALLLIFALPVVLLIYPMFNGGFHFPSTPQVVGIIILAVLFLSINTLLRAVMVVFSYGNWNLFVKQILERENGKH